MPSEETPQSYSRYKAVSKIILYVDIFMHLNFKTGSIYADAIVTLMGIVCGHCSLTVSSVMRLGHHNTQTITSSHSVAYALH